MKETKNYTSSGYQIFDFYYSGYGHPDSGGTFHEVTSAMALGFKPNAKFDEIDKQAYSKFVSSSLRSINPIEVDPSSCKIL